MKNILSVMTMSLFRKRPIKCRQRPNMTIAVDWDVKHQFEQNKQTFEPPRGKTKNVVSEQVQHKPTCIVTEKS